MKNIYDSWEEVKGPTSIGVWKKLILTLIEYFRGRSSCRCGRHTKRTRIRSGA
jgi:hypothetical protein